MRPMAYVKRQLKYKPLSDKAYLPNKEMFKELGYGSMCLTVYLLQNLLIASKGFGSLSTVRKENRQYP